MRFKPLEIKPQGNRFQRMIRTPHFRRSLRAVLIGAAIGFAFFYLSEGRNMEQISPGEVLKSLAIGAFFGFFVTNSPCARGRC